MLEYVLCVFALSSSLLSLDKIVSCLEKSTSFFGAFTFISYTQQQCTPGSAPIQNKGLVCLKALNVILSQNYFNFTSV